ncbi:MAG: serine hydrolase domain-containing protein [Bacteroidales bacterium]|nr:serine hydrolase domain-containing protein [Bacteroidales bacterium]
MKYIKPFASLIILLLLFPVLSSAQIPEDKLKAIDSLFLEWNRPNSPGGSVGIAVNGIPVFSEAYGLASMEYLVPNTCGTKFNIASVSKQFTAMGIVKLHLEGKLNIDDDIRQYLPEMPDFGHKITFRHMLHHTSGLRSLHTLLALAGWRDDDMKNNDDLLRFMTMQEDLNFEPGSEYMYCNTGYILSAIIIEKITGEKFADWMSKEIFEPLGLYNTYVEDKYNRIAHNYATSYNGSYNSGFVRATEYWAYTGSGNIHSTAADLLKWMRYYYNSPEGWQEAFSLMLTLDPFNNGKPNDYAFGVRIDDYKDETRISHSGSIGGFRSYACTFPEYQTEIVVLTNFSSSDVTGKINNISDILLGKEKEEKSAINYEEMPVDHASIEKFFGTYEIEGLDTRLFEILSENDTLYCLYTGGRKTEIHTASDTVLFNNERDIKIILINTSPASIIIHSDGQFRKGTKTDKFLVTDKYLSGIAGEYWSPELETQYRFYIRDGKLYGYQTRHGEFELESLKEDVLISDSGFIGKIDIVRKGKKVTGMKVTNSRVRNLWLEKR